MTHCRTYDLKTQSPQTISHLTSIEIKLVFNIQHLVRKVIVETPWPMTVLRQTRTDLFDGINFYRRQHKKADGKLEKASVKPGRCSIVKRSVLLFVRSHASNKINIYKRGFPSTSVCPCAPYGIWTRRPLCLLMAALFWCDDKKLKKKNTYLNATITRLIAKCK